MSLQPDNIPQSGTSLFNIFPGLSQFGSEAEAAMHLSVRKREYISSADDIVLTLLALPDLPVKTHSNLAHALYHSAKRYPLSEVHIKALEVIRCSLPKESGAIFWLKEMVSYSRKENWRSANASRKKEQAEQVSLPARREDVPAEVKFFSNRSTQVTATGGAPLANRFIRANKSTV